jgi:SSS family solute:Na+ symporter
MSDGQQLMIARVFVLVIVIATWILAQYAFEYRQSVFELGVWCFTGFAGMFPLVYASLYWRRLTAAGALSGILTLAAVWFFLFRESGWGAVSGYRVHLKAFGFSTGFEPVVVIFFATAISMIATSLITKAPDSERLARFFPEKKVA